MARALAVSVGAQVLVAPLLLIHFGLVPLLSPLANLLAAPLVAASTVLGVLGVIGPTPLSDLGAALARSSLGSPAPPRLCPRSVGWARDRPRGGLIHLFQPKLRGVLALLGAAGVAVLVLAPQSSLPDAGAVVLDVGQGDAILISGGPGNWLSSTVGPDPVVLIENLAQYRVKGLSWWC